MIRKLAGVAVFGCLFISPALAQAPAAASVEEMSAQDMVEKLWAAPVRRGVRNLTPVPRNLDLVVNFDLGSARIQRSSEQLLDNLAKAMQSERLAGQSFVLEGHTDSSGNAQLNQELSVRRASSVARFLAARGAPASRLKALGKGSSEPLNPANPEAAENRRVRVIAMPAAVN